MNTAADLLLQTQSQILPCVISVGKHKTEKEGPKRLTKKKGGKLDFCSYLSFCFSLALHRTNANLQQLGFSQQGRDAGSSLSPGISRSYTKPTQFPQPSS